ncbi:MAG: rhodanese-like domain-containing protein [Acidobacteriota bacterium]
MDRLLGHRFDPLIHTKPHEKNFCKPLDELRERLSELPREREIIAYCQSGQRSYNAANAARILSQHGFRVRSLTGSYRTWKTAQSHEQ